MSITNWFYFGAAFVQTDVPNPIDGGFCYAHAKVRPPWYWLCRRVRLFVLIVWRRFDPGCSRIDWSTAWQVSAASKGLEWRDICNRRLVD